MDGPFLNATCGNAQLYATSGFLRAVHVIQIVFSLASLSILVVNLPFRCFHQKQIHLHTNLKILLINAAILYGLHSISMLIVQAKHQV
uniref:Uncharacterized protein n=1 Tax=Acrobeloides nanus TaxID=290746 RepID=A0A914CGC4_9BILA